MYVRRTLPEAGQRRRPRFPGIVRTSGGCAPGLRPSLRFATGRVYATRRFFLLSPPPGDTSSSGLSAVQTAACVTHPILRRLPCRPPVPSEPGALRSATSHVIPHLKRGLPSDRFPDRFLFHRRVCKTGGFTGFAGRVVRPAVIFGSRSRPLCFASGGVLRPTRFVFSCSPPPTKPDVSPTHVYTGERT